MTEDAMYKAKPKNKRKALTPDKNMYKPNAKVVQLRIEGMALHIPGKGKLYFERLKYKGCPNFSLISKTNTSAEYYFKEGTVLIDMNRDAFIRELYSLLEEITTETCHGLFNRLITYLRWLDDDDELTAINGDYVHWELVDKYMTWCKEQYKLNKMSKSNWNKRKEGISWLLKAKGRTSDAKKLPSIKGVKKSTTPHKSLDFESEFKPTVKALFRAYKALKIHFNEKTTPERHPLWDEELVEKEAIRRGLKAKVLGRHKSAFKQALNNAHPNNHIVRISMLICYMFTGMNTKPLAAVKISDVYFTEVLGGKYILDSVKGRACYQDQDNSLGFSKHAKEFIESWLEIAKEMANGDMNAPLFPHYFVNGEIFFYSDIARFPQTKVNKLLKRLGLTEVNPSKFRKTKLDIIYRVTESVYLVAMAANNSMQTTRASYLHGTESEHKNNLGASMDAAFAIAKGQDVNTAVNDAKFHRVDVLDDYDFKLLRQGQDRSHESRTPTGVRCKDNRMGSAKVINKLLKRQGVEQSEDEVACTDFLECFSCSEHALVADENDIWLMLSFQVTLQELQQAPSINSMPPKKYAELFNQIIGVLERYKEASPKNYKRAEENLKDSPHPLYSNVYSLNDLLEVFA